MKEFLHSAKFLALDLASTLIFVAVFALTKNLYISAGLGIAMGVGQVIWTYAKGKKPDAMQWMSLGLVLVFGSASLFLHDPRFLMVKPSVIYAVVGTTMLTKGWMNRYLPPRAIEYVPDVGIAFGYVWAAMMYATGVANLVLAFWFPTEVWVAFMTVFPIVSKVALFVIQFGAMKLIGRRRARRMLEAGEALPVSA
ncbi:MAG: septation protein IspZ [Caulobacteraceae bacterium]